MAKKKTKSTSKPTLAELADKQQCYQLSVQSASHEIEFFEQAYREAYRRKPYVLREDFCGTFSVCCEWVKSKKKRIAIGVDLCGDTIQWGRDHNLAPLEESEQSRITLVQDDVRTRHRTKADVLAAQNFSFWIFKKRQEVIEYFKTARANLKPEGIMVLDMMGGPGCYEEQTDERKIGKGKKSFHYEWEQASFDPITRDASFYIHFSFQDNSRLYRAFEYHWRFWTIPEVREMLEEAGFSETRVYWETEDDSGEWERAESAESASVWICYVVGVK